MHLRQRHHRHLPDRRRQRPGVSAPADQFGADSFGFGFGDGWFFGFGFLGGVSGGEIYFKPSGFTVSSVYVHYTVSGQSQLNYAMSWNASAGQWQQPVSLSAGQSVSFSFDYTPTGQGYQDTTPTYSYSA